MSDKGVVLVIDDEVDEARTNAQGAAERAMTGVTLPCMLEHEVRQGCPRIADFFFQKAGDPQPRAVSSAFVFEIILIGPPAGLLRVELGPLPGQGRSRGQCWRRRSIGVAHAPSYSP